MKLATASGIIAIVVATLITVSLVQERQKIKAMTKLTQSIEHLEKNDLKLQKQIQDVITKHNLIVNYLKKNAQIEKLKNNSKKPWLKSQI